MPLKYGDSVVLMGWPTFTFLERPVGPPIKKCKSKSDVK